jgi:hypothetical protein
MKQKKRFEIGQLSLLGEGIGFWDQLFQTDADGTGLLYVSFFFCYVRFGEHNRGLRAHPKEKFNQSSGTCLQGRRN